MDWWIMFETQNNNNMGAVDVFSRVMIVYGLIHGCVHIGTPKRSVYDNMYSGSYPLASEASK